MSIRNRKKPTFRVGQKAYLACYFFGAGPENVKQIQIHSMTNDLITYIDKDAKIGIEKAWVFPTETEALRAMLKLHAETVRDITQTVGEVRSFARRLLSFEV